MNPSPTGLKLAVRLSNVAFLSSQLTMCGIEQLAKALDKKFPVYWDFLKKFLRFKCVGCVFVFVVVFRGPPLTGVRCAAFAVLD